MNSRRTKLAVAAAVVAAAATVAACGVPISGSPHALSKSDVPPPPPTTTTTTPVGIPFIVVWLNAAEEVAPQLLATPPKSDRLSTVLETLLRGPSTSGFSTQIPQFTTLVGVSPDLNALPSAAPANPITVNLSTQFLNSVGISEEILAVEQVVFTLACNLTPADKVTVAFQVEGNPQPVPIPDGTTLSTVTAADYGTLDCTTSSS